MIPLGKMAGYFRIIFGVLQTFLILSPAVPTRSLGSARVYLEELMTFLKILLALPLATLLSFCGKDKKPSAPPASALQENSEDAVEDIDFDESMDVEVTPTNGEILAENTTDQSEPTVTPEEDLPAIEINLFEGFSPIQKQQAEDCLAQWPNHPFTEDNLDGFDARILPIRIDILNPSKGAVDQRQTSVPEFVLVEFGLNFFDNVEHKFKNENGWYCLAGKLTPLLNVKVDLGCTTRVAQLGLDVSGDIGLPDGISIGSNVEYVQSKCD